MTNMLFNNATVYLMKVNKTLRKKCPENITAKQVSQNNESV